MTTHNLLTKVVTTAADDQLSAVYAIAMPQPLSALIRGKLTYGSGGTTIDAWVQTSFDGVTWIDVAQFSFTTSTAEKLFNLSALTAVTTQYTPTDKTLTANTCKDGIIGKMWRVKYKTVGTYAGSTTLKIDVSFNAVVVG